MDINIGDNVRFLNEVGGGKVTGFRKGGYILVEDADGFEIPMKESQVVVVPASSTKSPKKEQQHDEAPQKAIPVMEKTTLPREEQTEYTKSLEKRIIRLEMTIRSLEMRLERMEGVRQSKIEQKHHDMEEREKPSDGIIEVDLHIDSLVDNKTGLSAADIKAYQMKVFREKMDEYIEQAKRRTPKSANKIRIVFIHGNGDGVLRKAIIDELKFKYKQCEYQDASFQQYGFGATMVTVK